MSTACCMRNTTCSVHATCLSHVRLFQSSAFGTTVTTMWHACCACNVSRIRPRKGITAHTLCHSKATASVVHCCQRIRMCVCVKHQWPQPSICHALAWQVLRYTCIVSALCILLFPSSTHACALTICVKHICTTGS